MRVPSPNVSMIRTYLLLVSLVFSGLSLLGCVDQKRGPTRRAGRMDASRAFYYPDFATRPDTVLATHRDGVLDAGTYTRYLAGRFGTRYLEDLAFDILLERECRTRGLAKNALLLARSAASRRFHESGRHAQSDPDGSLQRKFINEALRKMRVDAVAGAARRGDPAAVRALFERHFGIDGARVRVRHVLVSFRATARRLEASGMSAEPDEVRAAAKARATSLRRRIDDGEAFVALLGASDDRTTKRMLRDAEQAPHAGFLPNYNYQRYGDEFAGAAQRQKVGGVSAPVASSVGYHLVEVLARQVTKLADVEQRLRERLGRGSAKPVEVAALRRRLFAKYGFATPNTMK
jgi:PPIC-type PPIASE domain